jgi:mRNA-degrading endonuclease RelE of RelBE toxin-antitoxin system
MTYHIRILPRCRASTASIDRPDRNIVLEVIEEQLSHQPEVQTRHRKLMRENPLADWELRVGEYRVFYDVDNDQDIVMVLAIGLKSHSTLWIEGQETQP